MSYAKIHSAQVTLLTPTIIDIEIDLLRGLHSFSIVGLPDKAVEESRDRVSSALKNSGCTPPKKYNQKITIALAPANIKKEGPAFDLAIALGFLKASNQLSNSIDKALFLGELSLDGHIRPINGVLPLVLHAYKKGFKEIFVPSENAPEASCIKNMTVYAPHTLRDCIDHIKGVRDGAPFSLVPVKYVPPLYEKPSYALSCDDIRGNEEAKRGLEIAASGRHNIALFGPPGTGKTMLARALSSLLPPLSLRESLEVTSIHSIAGNLQGSLITHPPFRSPHHTSSYVSLVGGGTYPKPGEVTLAHRGILFLDELPEFDRKVLEALREPLEEKVVTISRSKASATFPAHVLLLAAMNPCPCGNHGSTQICTCSPHTIDRYQKKLSGPIVDRIDMWIEVSKISYEKLSLSQGSISDSDSDRKARITRARERQKVRFKNHEHLTTNSDMDARELSELIHISTETRDILNESAEKLALSARAYHKVIKMARTIADLEDSDDLSTHHILEALQYRPKAR